VTRREGALCSLLAVAGLVTVAVFCSHSHRDAAARLAAAEDARDRRVQDLARVQRSRAQGADLVTRRREEAGMVSLANRAFLGASLPADGHLKGIQARQDREIPDSRIRYQVAELRLTALRPDELGSWLRAFRAQAPEWKLSECQWMHHRGRGGNADENRYDATMVFSAPYLAVEGTR